MQNVGKMTYTTKKSGTCCIVIYVKKKKKSNYERKILEKNKK